MLCKLINTPCLKSSILLIAVFSVFSTTLSPTRYVAAEEADSRQFKSANAVLATVDGDEITVGQFTDFAKNLGRHTASLADVGKLLDARIERQVLLRHARSRELKGRDDELLRALRNQLRSTIKLTEKQVKDYYESHKNDFVSPGRAWAIVITIRNEEDASAIPIRVSKGEDFYDVAAEWVEPKRLAPKLYFKGRSYIPEQLGKIIFSVEENKPSKPIKHGDHYDIVFVTERWEGRDIPLSKAERLIRRRLITHESSRAMKQLADNLKSKAKIMKNEEALKACFETLVCTCSTSADEGCETRDSNDCPCGCGEKDPKRIRRLAQKREQPETTVPEGAPATQGPNPSKEREKRPQGPKTELAPAGQRALKLQFKFREGMLQKYVGDLDLAWLGPDDKILAKSGNTWRSRITLEQLIIKLRDDKAAEMVEKLVINEPIPESLQQKAIVVPKSITRWMLVRENGVVIESRSSNGSALDLLPVGGDANFGILPLILNDKPVKAGDTWTVPDAWTLSSGEESGGKKGEVQYEYQNYTSPGRPTHLRVAVIRSQLKEDVQTVLFYPDQGTIWRLHGVRTIPWRGGKLECRLELEGHSTRARASKRTIIEDAQAMDLGACYDIRNLIEPVRVQTRPEGASTPASQKETQPESSGRRFKLQFKLTEGDRLVYHYERTLEQRGAEKQLARYLGRKGQDYTEVIHVFTTMVVTRDYGNGDFEITRLENPQLVKAIIDGEKMDLDAFRKFQIAWEDRAQATRAKMNKNGRIVDYPAGGWYESSGPCANINYVLIPGYLPDKPVAVGESWEQNVKLENHGYRDCKIKWTLVGVEPIVGYDCLKIRAVLEPTNAPTLKGGEQTIWFAYEEGLLVKIIGDCSHVSPRGEKTKRSMSALLISRERLSRERLIGRAQDGLDFIRTAQYYQSRSRFYDARSFYQIFLERCPHSLWVYGVRALEKRVQAVIKLWDERGEVVAPSIVEFKKK